MLSSPLQPRLTTVTPRHPPSPLRAGANTTWWGNYGGGDGSVLLGLPPCDFGPTLTWVGRFTRTVTNTACAATRWSVEQIGAGRRLVPQDLFEAQRRLRGLLPP